MGVAVRMACLEVLTRKLRAGGMIRRTLIRNARLLDPASGLDARGGLLVEHDRIVDFGPGRFESEPPPDDAVVIDAGGRLPGAGAGRHARAVRRARRRAQGDVRERHDRGGRRRRHQPGLPAQHRAADRRSGDGRVRRPPRPPGEAGQGLSLRRRHPGLRRPRPHRDGAAQGGGRGRLHRRRPAGRPQPGHAPRHGLCQRASTAGSSSTPRTRRSPRAAS